MAYSRTNTSATPQLILTIISQMNELAEIMKIEPELIMARKLEEHAKLLKRKQKLAAEYLINIKSIASQPEMIKQLPQDARRQLKEVGQKLAQQAESNGRSLRATIMAVQRLIQNIVAYIKSEVLAKPGYKNPNTSYLELGNYSPTCKPVAVNRSA